MMHYIQLLTPHYAPPMHSWHLAGLQMWHGSGLPSHFVAYLSSPPTYSLKSANSYPFDLISAHAVCATFILFVQEEAKWRWPWKRASNRPARIPTWSAFWSFFSLWNWLCVKTWECPYNISSIAVFTQRWRHTIIWAKAISKCVQYKMFFRTNAPQIETSIPRLYYIYYKNTWIVVYITKTQSFVFESLNITSPRFTTFPKFSLNLSVRFRVLSKSRFLAWHPLVHFKRNIQFKASHSL